MKPKFSIFLVGLFLKTNPLIAQTNVIDLGTGYVNTWLASSANVSDATPFVFNYGPNDYGISINSIGQYDPSIYPSVGGYFIGYESPTNFDGFWRADNNFFLPSNATNVVLTFNNFFADDAGVLELNGAYISSTETSATDSTPLTAYMVFTDGAPRQAITFFGPDGEVGGVISSYFLTGATNTLSVIINNTGLGANGLLSNAGPTSFRLSASISYEITAVQPSITINTFPGITINGTIGGTYAIQSATNLTNPNWTTITTLTLQSSPFIFFDTNAITSTPHRFYRAQAL